MSLSRSKKYNHMNEISKNSELRMSDSSENLYISLEVSDIIKHYEDRIFKLEETLENTKSDLYHISTLFIEEKEHLKDTSKRLQAYSRENEDLKAYIQDLHVVLEKRWSQQQKQERQQQKQERQEQIQQQQEQIQQQQQQQTSPIVENYSHMVSLNNSSSVDTQKHAFCSNHNKILDSIANPFDINDERIIIKNGKKYCQWRYHLMGETYWYDEEEIPEFESVSKINKVNNDNENDNEGNDYKKKIEEKKKAYQYYIKNECPKWDKLDFEYLDRECLKHIKKRQQKNTT